jgi:hypothetical protein
VVKFDGYVEVSGPGSVMTVHSKSNIVMDLARALSDFTNIESFEVHIRDGKVFLDVIFTDLRPKKG